MNQNPCIIKWRLLLAGELPLADEDRRLASASAAKKARGESWKDGRRKGRTS
jgi:hypothetical protein